MINIAVICEGQTEALFIKEIFNTYFNGKIIFYPMTIPTSTNKKGGCLDYEKTKAFIHKINKTESYNYITTMFDYYALKSNFPDINNSSIDNPDIYIKINNLENSLKRDIDNLINNTKKFIPYYQLYEFETLLYTDIDKFKIADPEWKDEYIGALKNDIKNYDNIELINNSKETSPSHRIEKIFIMPRYNKLFHGIKIIKEIGLDNIRQKCKHFDDWCKKLESCITIQTI